CPHWGSTSAAKACFDADADGERDQLHPRWPCREHAAGLPQSLNLLLTVRKMHNGQSLRKMGCLWALLSYWLHGLNYRKSDSWPPSGVSSEGSRRANGGYRAELRRQPFDNFEPLRSRTGAPELTQCSRSNHRQALWSHGCRWLMRVDAP